MFLSVISTSREPPGPLTPIGTVRNNSTIGRVLSAGVGAEQVRNIPNGLTSRTCDSATGARPPLPGGGYIEISNGIECASGWGPGRHERDHNMDLD